MKIKSFLYPLFYKYQRSMFYLMVSGGEIGKPLRFYSETIQLITLLGVYGFFLTGYQIAASYIIIIIIAIIAGKILDVIGVVRYNQELSNKRNDDLQKILRKVETIERLLDKNDK